jgi:carbon monoxide dehydrogenase subunit G
MIELDGKTEYVVKRELLWEMILDPDVLARIVPGCKKLEIVNENEYQGQMRIKVGPMDGVFRGTVALSELNPPHSFHLVMNGRGPSGIVEGEGDVYLQDAENGTEFSYTGQGQISGRMASVGQRVMTSSARAVVKQSLENLDKQVQARVQPQPAAAAAPGASVADTAPALETPPEAPSQAEFMRGVAENMLEEFVPDPGQRRALGGLVIGAILIIALNWFANLVARRVVKMLQEESAE